jgi:hypothetical protein
MDRIILVIIMALVLGSCRKREELLPRNKTGEFILEEKGKEVDFSEGLEGIVTIPLAIQGTWEVVEYSKEKIDQTIFFTGFEFTFNADGTVKATKGDIVVMGTYKVVPSGDVNNLVITFPATTPFPSLNYIWSNSRSSDTEMSFEYTSKDLVLRRK